MVARTSSGSGLFSAVVGNCVNGDTFNIQAGHNVTLDVDLSVLTTGLGASTINGVLDCKADVATGLFMNGNLDVNGALYIANRAVVSGFTLTTGKTNVYEVARTLRVATVEETLGNGYKDVVDELTDIAESIENSRLRGLNEPEMMPDVVKEFRINYMNSLTLADALNYLESNPSKFYHDTTNNKLYINTSDSSNPSTKTITVIEPIQRPTGGTESRCNIKFNATGVISNTGGGTPVIRMYGWYPSREWSQASSDVALNATQIPFNHDVGLQAGDVIGIGSGTEYGGIIESNKGVYTVQSYDAGTKIVTLTSGLQTARLKDDYVAIISKPITMSRVSGTTTYINTKFDNAIIVGVRVKSGGYIVSSPIVSFSANWVFKHSVCQTRPFGAVLNPIIEDCVGMNVTTISAYGKTNINRCISINNQVAQIYHPESAIDYSVSQNSAYSLSTSGNLINSIFKNQAYGLTNGVSLTSIKNCIFDINQIIPVIYQTNVNTVINNIKNSIFKSSCRNLFSEFAKLKLMNCIIEDNATIDISNYPKFGKIESFDHNQTVGNYKAWMRGGRIITENNKLKFICESNDYPVFKDYPILAPANRTIKRLIGLTKSTPEIITKVQFIDPANDPLIDSTAIPLAESSEIVNNQIGIAYKSDTAKQIILRIYCQNSTGNVIIETTRIDQALVKRIE